MPGIDEQEKGFHQRAMKQLVWLKLDLRNFPRLGILRMDREWFASLQVDYVSSDDEEDLVLINCLWNGWPDPPGWGLASRSIGQEEADWKLWGNLSELPGAWIVPGLSPKS